MEWLDLAAEIVSGIFLVLGGFFVFAGAVGIFRFPDFYTRLHAAGVTDTLGAELILIGLCFQAGFTLITVKLLFVVFFVFFTSPTSTHAIANAAIRAGLRPYMGAAGTPDDKKHSAAADQPGRDS